jgi:hypothetical protein
MYLSSADHRENATYSTLRELLLLSGDKASQDDGGKKRQLHGDRSVGSRWINDSER